MKSTKPTEMSNEDLLKSKKILKPLVIMLAIALLLLFGMSLYKTFTNQSSPLMITSLALMPILFINIGSLSKINKEIKARNL
ncbi:MAG: hypothetical protein V4581_18420 [Bacteroidota bacterium]